VEPVTRAEAKQIPLVSRTRLEKTAPPGLYRVRGEGNTSRAVAIPAGEVVPASGSMTPVPGFKKLLLARVKAIPAVPAGADTTPGRRLEIPMGVEDAHVRADGKSLLILQYVLLDS
jgi:hypothetical protein